MVRYHLFGSSVDCVTTLEQACTPGRILVSEPFARALRPLNPFLGGSGRDEPGTSTASGAPRSQHRPSASPGVAGSPVFGPMDASGVGTWSALFVSGMISGTEGEASHAPPLPSQRRLLLRDKGTQKASARKSISLVELTTTHTEPDHASAALEGESPEASSHALDLSAAGGGSTRASFGSPRLSHDSPSGVAPRTSGLALPPLSGASGVRQQAAAGTAADSEAFDLEPAPSLMLKGLGMCRTFHFADVIPRPPHL